MNFKAILYYLSLFCFPVSFLAFINILYSSYFDYFLNVDSYSTTLISSFLVGLILFFFGKNSSKRINFFEQIILIVLIYLLISAFVSIPYYLSIYQIPLINALFEGFSGVTGTGFSIFDNIKYIDPTLIIWRSSSQWIGGLYFLIILIVIFSNKQFNYKLNYLTYSGDGGVNSKSNIKKIILNIFLLYVLLSFIIFFILSIFEVRLFNALNLTMTLISSGGFLPTNSLSQIIKTTSQEFCLIIAFLISMLNFFFIFNLFNKRKIINEHKEDFAIMSLFVFFVLILVIEVKDLSFIDASINILSSLTNSGIFLNEPSKNISFYFLLLTIIGGSLISNTSGIKLIRIYILVKTTSSEILKLIRPNNVINQNIFNSNKKIDNENTKNSFLIFISFFLSLLILSVLLSLNAINFENSFKISILTLTNTTNSELFGISRIDFANLLTSSKITLIIFMIVGKIELISFFLIIKKLFFKN